MQFNQGFGSAGVRIEHHMPDDGSGVYIKEVHIPAGISLDMHTHTFTHKSVLCSGKVLVLAHGNVTEYTGPCVLHMGYGIPHAVQAITNAVWMCVHATDELNVDQIDSALIGEEV